MSPLVTSPAIALGLISLHLWLGHFVSAAIYRWRFHRSPLVLYRAGNSGEHQRRTRLVGAASLLWAASIVGFAFSDTYRMSFFGAPRLELASWIGGCVGGVALLGMVVCQVAMGPAFRVGQDEREAPRLWNRGPFALSRNPIYLFSWTSLAGFTLWAPNLVSIFTIGVIGALMHSLVLAEEAHLRSRLGESYQAYVDAVPRYLGLPKTRRAA